MAARSPSSSLPPAGSVVRRIQKWTWLSIYAGLVALGLGLTVRRADEPLGWAILAFAGVAIAIGVTLIWVRSRLPDPIVQETRT